MKKKQEQHELDGGGPNGAPEGLAAREADVLVEATASSADNGEPGTTHSGMLSDAGFR